MNFYEKVTIIQNKKISEMSDIILHFRKSVKST